MKKALALVLALVLALSLGVSAFAITLVELDKEPSSAASREEIEFLAADEENHIFYAEAEGGAYYLGLKDAEALKNITVTTDGPVAGEIVKYDSDKMTGLGSSVWNVYKKDGTLWKYDEASKEEKEAYDKLVLSKNYDKVVEGEYVYVLKAGGTAEPNPNHNKMLKASCDANPTWTLAEILKWYQDTYKDGGCNVSTHVSGATCDQNCNFTLVKEIKQKTVFDGTTEKFAKDLATALNNVNKSSTRYHADSVDGVEGTKLLKLTVEPNYTAAYKLGTFTVKANKVTTDGDGKVLTSEKVVYNGYVVSDVTIFEYEEVKWAGKNEVALKVGDKGYSDFYFDGKYSKDGNKYIESELRQHDNATVVSTTAFRALRENGDALEVEAGYMTVKVPEIVSGQKGVNFAYKTGADGSKETTVKDGVTAVYTNKYKTVLDNITFGFYGNQTIASDFVVEANLGLNAYELREAFGEKVEEEDIITYYIVEGDKVVGQFTVDYAKDDIDEKLKLEINRKAGQTLGMYKIVLEAPATTPAEGEENPNTGAESVIGVVAAMAVVSVAAAAAVSLKK